jgi:hypothetical protein
VCLPTTLTSTAPETPLPRSIRTCFRSKEVSTYFIEHFAPFKFTYMLCKGDRAAE